MPKPTPLGKWKKTPRKLDTGETGDHREIYWLNGKMAGMVFDTGDEGALWEADDENGDDLGGGAAPSVEEAVKACEAALRGSFDPP